MLLLLLLLSLTGVVLGGCPPPSLMHPCKCKNEEFGLSVGCYYISSTQDLQAMVDRTVDYPFARLLLYNASIPYINASWLAAKSTRELFLAHCRFQALFHPTPKDPLPLMKTVFVVNSSVQVQWKDFRPFVRLQALYLKRMEEVQELGKGFKENVTPELRELHLEHTPISSLGGGVFDGKKKLSSIDIKHSAIKVVKNSDFRDQKKSMTWMDLSYNPIESLPDDLFEGFERLIWVSLKGIKVKTLQEALFTPLNRLRKVHVEDIPLVCGCRMEWILNDRINLKFVGTCDSPSTLQGKELSKLTIQDFDACGQASNQARRNGLPFEH